MIHNQIPKTLGSKTALLFTQLYEQSKTTFTLADVEAITGLRGTSARTLVHKATKRGLLTRLQPGLYTLVPFELGNTREYVGDPYLIAKSLVHGDDYFLSHRSAMELHRMVTQPQLTIMVSCAKSMRLRSIHGYEYRFLVVRPKFFFGLTSHWIDKQQSVAVSDPERTIVDGLRHPQYVGGVTEVARAVFLRRKDLDVKRLVDYALRLNVGAVIRRLGFLLETCSLETPESVSALQSRLTSTYEPLDNSLPPEGPYQARWRVRVNVSPEELRAVAHT
ncbi:MAG: type IV toxin-antitoxin system AbiEi family antitoxin domain-containing protein [Candidatus Acidiferrum sp.]